MVSPYPRMVYGGALVTFRHRLILLANLFRLGFSDRCLPVGGFPTGVFRSGFFRQQAWDGDRSLRSADDFL